MSRTDSSFDEAFLDANREFYEHIQAQTYKVAQSPYVFEAIRRGQESASLLSLYAYELADALFVHQLSSIVKLESECFNLRDRVGWHRGLSFAHTLTMFPSYKLEFERIVALMEARLELMSDEELSDLSDYIGGSVDFQRVIHSAELERYSKALDELAALFGDVTPAIAKLEEYLDIVSCRDLLRYSTDSDLFSELRSLIDRQLLEGPRLKDFEEYVKLAEADTPRSITRELKRNSVDLDEYEQNRRKALDELEVAMMLEFGL